MKFGLDPDLVWQKDTDDVLVWIYKWKSRAEFDDRYREVEKKINAVQ